MFEMFEVEYVAFIAAKPECFSTLHLTRSLQCDNGADWQSSSIIWSAQLEMITQDAQKYWAVCFSDISSFLFLRPHSLIWCPSLLQYCQIPPDRRLNEVWCFFSHCSAAAVTSHCLANHAHHLAYLNLSLVLALHHKAGVSGMPGDQVMAAKALPVPSPYLPEMTDFNVLSRKLV